MMDNLMKFSETESDIIYMIDNNQGLVSIPKDLKNNIKVFMMFGDSNISEEERNKIVNNISEVSKRINDNDDDGICIVTFINSDVTNTNDAIIYTEELNRIKMLVNNIYNKLLAEGKFTKDNFVKKIELLYTDLKYKNFMDFLCLQNPSKFHANSYQELMNEVIRENSNSNMDNTNTTTVNNTPVSNASNNYVNNNVTYPSQFDSNTDYINNTNSLAKPNSVEPINEGLSIGSVPFEYQNLNNKTLVKTKPNNAAFIKLPTIIFIIAMSLVIGITISVSLLK